MQSKGKFLYLWYRQINFLCPVLYVVRMPFDLRRLPLSVLGHSVVSTTGWLSRPCLDGFTGQRARRSGVHTESGVVHLVHDDRRTQCPSQRAKMIAYNYYLPLLSPIIAGIVTIILVMVIIINSTLIHSLFLSLSPRAQLHVVGILWFMSKTLTSRACLPPFRSVLVSISVLMALSTVFHSINSLDNSPISHFVLPVLPAFFCLIGPFSYISLWRSPSALIWSFVVDWLKALTN